MYEVYLRSFADSDGDGVGDIGGLRRRLPYLADLGVDAVWITPWYPSPMADGGYDVADYCAIDQRFGSLVEADTLVAEAHALGVRVIIDMVANHTSEQHPWFVAALAAGPGSPERARYFFRDGRAGGAEPPNDWISAFGGRAWTRVVEPDGRPGQWYLHLFAPQQPDLDWTHPGVRDDFDGILRFWFDRGIDGVRVDAAPAMAKVAGLPDAGHAPGAQFESRTWVGNPHWDVDEVHEILRRWRRIGDSYEGDRLFVTEAVVNGPERLGRYVRPDEMHTSFNFDYLTCPWDAGRLRAVIDESLAALEPLGAPATWVLSSHDETRHVTRFGRVDTSGTTGSVAPSPGAAPAADPALGLRRARAAALLTLALPGSAYLYQGEELGLPEVEDLPEEALQDPTWARSGHTVRGRDGCRVPLPWAGDRPPFGFSAPGVRPWLPQPAEWASSTVAAQQADDGSMLALYRAALRLRRSLRGTGMTWRPSAGDVLAFDRGRLLRCVVNLGDRPVDLTGQGRVLLASAPSGPELPPDAAAWLVPGDSTPA